MGQAPSTMATKMDCSVLAVIAYTSKPERSLMQYAGIGKLEEMYTSGLAQRIGTIMIVSLSLYSALLEITIGAV
jgi:hypothetical protein